MDLTDEEYEEALTLARASLSHGGKRTLLAKALLRAHGLLAPVQDAARGFRDEPGMTSTLVIRNAALATIARKA